MSIPKHYNTNDRFDNASSLPPSTNNQFSHSTDIDSRGVAVTSVIPHTPPWSHINSRLGGNPAPVYWHPEWPTPGSCLHDHELQSYHPRVLEESLATIESKLGISVPDGGTPVSCSPAPSPPLPRPWAAASTASTPLALPAYKEVDNNKISCGICGVTFTGAYRRGNLGRHVRQKHTEAKGGPYTCAANGCYAVFKRQDARLKHAHKHHPGLYPEPVSRRHAHESISTPSRAQEPAATATNQVRSRPIPIPPRTVPDPRSKLSEAPEQYRSLQDSLRSEGPLWPQPMTGVERSSTADTIGSSTVASSLDFHVGQWSTSPQSTCTHGLLGHSRPASLCYDDSSSIEVEELPQAARIVFRSLHQKLDSDLYSRFCDTTFRRLEVLAQFLRDKQSDTYDVYAKVLQDLYAVVHAIDSGVIEATNIDESIRGVRTRRPGQEQNSRDRSRTAVDLVQSITSPSNRELKHSGRGAASSSGPGRDVKVTKSSRVKRPEGREFDCPEHKHHVMNLTQQTQFCRGCRQTKMSQLRSHIKRVAHRDFSGVWQCPACKKDFVDQREYERHREADSCHHQAQTRGDIIIPWARLYLTRYPGATRIPSPFSGDSSWLPDSVLSQCRAFLNATPSFLGQPIRDPADAAQRRPNHAIDTDSYHALLGAVLHDVIAPVPIRNAEPPLGVLAERVSDLVPSRMVGLPHDNRSDEASRRRFLNTLDGLSLHLFRVLADAPRYCNEQQLRQTADEFEAVVHNIRRYCQQSSHQQQNHLHTQATPSQQQQLSQHGDAYTTPVRSRRSPSASSGNPGTHNSSQGFDTSSSGHRLSTQTDPSSVTGLSNSDFLSPPAQHVNANWTSSAVQPFLNNPQHHGDPSDSQLLLNVCPPTSGGAQSSSPTIDPALLGSTVNDDDWMFSPS